MKFTLRKYIDSTEVMNRVSSSLKTYKDSDLILLDDYYKVIDLCNQRMGLRINPTKEVLLKVEDGRALLPDDFHLLNLALLVGTKVMSYSFPLSKTEYLTSECPTTKDLKALENKCCDFKLECGRVPKLTCKYEQHTFEFEETFIVRLTEKKYTTSDCFNLNVSNSAIHLMEITNDQIFIDNVKDGYIYLQYQSIMKEEGNLPICIDNEIVLNYYEQALKYEILFDLYVNKKLEVAQALPLMERRKNQAEREAISLVRTPEFDELMSISTMLKKRYYKLNNQLK
jgi:hypothetical protein